MEGMKEIGKREKKKSSFPDRHLEKVIEQSLCFPAWIYIKIISVGRRIGLDSR
jgi:hypothetical protein